MSHDAQNRIPEDDGSDLAEIAERYLDGRLPEREAHAFEQRLREDADARTALLDVIAFQLIVETALTPVEEACSVVRGLIPAYRQGRLDPAGVGRLSRHLEECAACTGYHAAVGEGAAGWRGRWRRLTVALAAGGILLAGGAAGWILRDAMG